MITKDSNLDLSFYQYLSQPDCWQLFYNSAILTQLPIALWRLPNSHQQELIIDFSGRLKKINIDFATLPPGFILSPFVNQEGLSAFLVEAHLYLNHSTCTFLNNGGGINGSHILHNQTQFKNTLKELCVVDENKKNGKFRNYPYNWYKRVSEMPVPLVTNEDYCVWVELALAKIKKSELKKVVLSRSIEIELRKSFNPLVLFENLCNAFPNAFVSLVALPGVGTWIGATPELLMGIKNKALTTVSLAGTKPVAVNAEINWGDKEIVEQAIVSDYIKACFLQQNINHFTEEGPTTVQIGNLVHLQTKFSLKLSSDNLTIDVNRLLYALHPTPAVCGVPKQKAFRFIQEKESHNRELYSGFLGPVNLQEQSQLFVNLRCLQLQKSSAILYAGSGITKDSIPEQESFETELKLKALLNFLNNIPKTNESPNPFSEKYSVIDRILCDDRF